MILYLDRDCAFGQCDRPQTPSGLCKIHQKQADRGAGLQAISPRRAGGRTAADRATDYVTRAEEFGECLLHAGYFQPGEYPTIRFRGRQWKVHRFVYEHLKSPIPAGGVVHHKCANRRCINVDHLQLVSPAENNAEMLERTAMQRRIAELEAQILEMQQ
ncbi:HNH endonuclease signature motif containing protein [Streptomyces sp. NPDC029080]|uniref:HNH endonuclease signature motif containing protein n=1 Tax=Streptomyces sp. NPDC029080 TaxID=3155017 RepID=UPI003406010C